MEHLGPIELVLLLLVVATGAGLPRAPARRRVPDPARPRRPGARGLGSAWHRTCRRGRARAGPRLPAVPAADPVRRGLLHADPRLQGERPADRPAGHRARAVHDGRRRGRRLVRSSRSWRAPPAFTLGAIVAPPDAVAATAIFRRLGVPRRVVTILEGESLINDASALIAYRVADRGGGDGRLLARRGGRVVRRRRSRRDRGRGRRRLARHERLAAHGRPDAGDRRLAARAADRLPVRGAARRDRASWRR